MLQIRLLTPQKCIFQNASYIWTWRVINLALSEKLVYYLPRGNAHTSRRVVFQLDIRGNGRLLHGDYERTREANVQYLRAARTRF